jgi:hypothetical protein
MNQHSKKSDTQLRTVIGVKSIYIRTPVAIEKYVGKILQATILDGWNSPY